METTVLQVLFLYTFLILFVRTSFGSFSHSYLWHFTSLFLNISLSQFLQLFNILWSKLKDLMWSFQSIIFQIQFFVVLSHLAQQKIKPLKIIKFQTYLLQPSKFLSWKINTKTNTPTAAEIDIWKFMPWLDKVLVEG